MKLTEGEKRTLAVVEELGEGDTWSVAARLWPHWRTQRGRMTAASEGKAFMLLTQLKKKGAIELTGNTFRALARKEKSLFQLRNA